MIFKSDIVDILQKEILAAEEVGEKVLFVQSALIARPHLGQTFPLMGWQKIINLYNAIYGTRFHLLQVLYEKIPLYHSFVLHRDTFKELMFFAEFAIPKLFELLNYETKHLPYDIERLHGIFLKLHTLNGRIQRWIPLSGSVIHTDRLKDDWKGEVRSEAI
jgi:hypothetical protein